MYSGHSQPWGRNRGQRPAVLAAAYVCISGFEVIDPTENEFVLTCLESWEKARPEHHLCACGMIYLHHHLRTSINLRECVIFTQIINHINEYMRTNQDWGSTHGHTVLRRQLTTSHGS